MSNSLIILTGLIAAIWFCQQETKSPAQQNAADIGWLVCFLITCTILEFA